MRTLISVASVCTLFVLAASNAACSRTTHTSVSDKSQPKPVRPDIDTSRREPVTTEPSSKYPNDLPGDTGFQHDTTPGVLPPSNPFPTTPPNNTTPNKSTIPPRDPTLPPNDSTDSTLPKSDSTMPKPSKPDDTQKSTDTWKPGSGLQSPESTDPMQRDADNKLATQVRSAIIADATVASNADAVTVTCRSGVCTLQGTVKDQEQKDAIVLAVQRVPGVDRVDDQLTLPRH
jgi:hypothetical protein